MVMSAAGPTMTHPAVRWTVSMVTRGGADSEINEEGHSNLIWFWFQSDDDDVDPSIYIFLWFFLFSVFKITLEYSQMAFNTW